MIDFVCKFIQTGANFFNQFVSHRIVTDWSLLAEIAEEKSVFADALDRLENQSIFKYPSRGSFHTLMSRSPNVRAFFISIACLSSGQTDLDSASIPRSSIAQDGTTFAVSAASFLMISLWATNASYTKNLIIFATVSTVRTNQFTLSTYKLVKHLGHSKHGLGSGCRIVQLSTAWPGSFDRMAKSRSCQTVGSRFGRWSFCVDAMPTRMMRRSHR